MAPFGPASPLGPRTSPNKVETILLDGGDPPQSEPCEAKAQHGYLGIELKAVDAIAAFIKKQRE